MSVLSVLLKYHRIYLKFAHTHTKKGGLKMIIIIIIMMANFIIKKKKVSMKIRIRLIRTHNIMINFLLEEE